MKKNTRDSGIDIIGEVPWGTHFCQFYQTKEDLMDILIPYFKAGLENNEFCIWITSPSLELEEAKEALRKSIRDFDVYQERGQIEIIPHSHWYIKEGFFDSEKAMNKWFEKLDRALTKGYDGLRLTEDASWIKKNWSDLTGFEEKLDNALGNNQIIALYSYSLDRCSSAEMINVAFNHQLTLIKETGEWEKRESPNRQNINNREPTEEAPHQNIQHARVKLEGIISPEREIANLELADIVDSQAIQSLMNDFYNFAHIAMALVDLKGNVLVSVGWQDICTRFHRVHPETCRYCIESDTKLSSGIPPGEFKLYRCRNNMWDIATPVIAGGQHVGNIFLGQFFFEDETPDYELFRSHARKYGFNEEEYIAALEKVPRLSLTVVNTCMAFFMTLANMLSQLSYSNFKLTQLLTERDVLVEALRESEEKYRSIVETANEGIWVLDAKDRTTYVNKKMAEMLGYRQKEIIGRSVWDFSDEEGKAIAKLNMEKKRQGIDESLEFKLICKDGSTLWTFVNTKSSFGRDGKYSGSMGMLTDITERKQEEHRIRRYNRILKGINLVFSSVVQAKTEEEVGNACLSVALEVTGSQFGFINEMGADGLLHDVAKSELAWEQCFMYDKTGHRRPPSIFTIHGLYGSVIINEKGFFTNDPPSHPDSIGIPDGHPPITSFLGVPLVQDGKTIGLIAVANREGGYGFEQKEDLKAIAPAVVQVLQRKKAEQKQKQAEKALQVSEERYRSLYENSLDGILLTKPDGTILCANPQACQMFGMTEDEIIQLGRESLVVNDEKLAAALEVRRQTGQMRAELIHRRKDGSTFVCDTTSKLFVDADGNINTSLIVRDISERKQAEEALRASEEKFRKIVETASEGIWLIDSNEQTVFVNRKMSEMLGYSIDEIMGQSPRKFMSPEFHSKADDILHEHLQGIYRVVDYSFIRKDGSELWCIVSSSPLFDDHGKYAGSLLMITDITERKKAEEALKMSNLYNRSLIEASLDPLVTIGHDGKINDVNNATEQVTGYLRRELIGTDFSDYFTEPEKARAGYKQVFTDGKIWDYPLEIQHKDGHITPVLYNASVYRDETGKVIGIFAAARDITERKRAEEALQKSQAELAKAQLISQIGSWTWDLITNEVTWSEQSYRNYGLVPGEMEPSYELFLSFIVPEDRERVDREVKKAIESGHTYSITYNIIRTDGTPRILLSESEIVMDESGKIVLMYGTNQDITERKKAEEALKKAHDNLEKIVEERTAELEKAYNSLKESERGLAEAQKMTHSGNWEWDIATDKAYWSEEMYRIFRRDPQKLAPSLDEYLSYIHPDDLDYYRKINNYKTNIRTSGLDFRIVLANGEERTLHIKSDFIYNDENIPVRVKGTVQDITERKKTEEKIQILANAVESSSDAIITVSLEGIITSWNKAAEQVYGYSAQEVIGKSVSILAPSNLRDETKKLTEKVIQGEKVHQYETLRSRKDGTLINVSITLSPVFDITRKLVAISGIVRDVTERIRAEEALRESEARMRLFYESDMLGVCYYNVDGSVTDANDRFLEIVGYTREDLQAGKVNWNKMTPPEYRSLDEQIIAELKSTGLKGPREKEYIRKDGSRVPVIVGAATFDKVRNGGTAFVLDITENKKTQKALANIEITRKKEIHHRIKNNLQVISSLLDLQADKFDNPKVIEAFRESQNRVVSMALIHEELYKGEGTDTLDFCEYIKELTENLFRTYSLSSKNIDLKMDLEENALFNMDVAVPLGIIVNELVSNSLKHAFQGRDIGEIRIELHRQKNGEHKKEGNKTKSFILIVSDNGIGIPENIVIQDLDSLGMQLITTLVDQLDGKLELRRNNGTEFAIRFTVAEEDNQLSEPALQRVNY